MFQDTYKSAYDKITLQGGVEVSEAQIADWLSKENMKEDSIREINTHKKCLKRKTQAINRKKSGIGRLLRPVAAVALMACLVVILGVPVAAKTIPGFYEVLERNAPGLADYLIPVQKSDSSAGIVMNLEAAKVEGNTAEILVSFTDDGDRDDIHGMVDMYDSYNLHSYSGDSNIGGCSFMEYDEAQDKAYFQIDLISSDGTFDTDRMEFEVYQLLTNCQSYVQEISIEDAFETYNLKAVTLNGGGGRNTDNSALAKLTIPGNEIDPRPGHLVMDIPLDNCSPDEMKVTGVAYMDGILRVQLFRGNFKEADRHMRVYLLDKAGNQVYPDMSVMWHDEVAGEEMLVDEFYFVVTEEQVTEYTLWGAGEVRSGSIKGNWSITFELE